MGVLFVSFPVLMFCLVEVPERYSEFFHTLLVRYPMLSTVLLDREEFFTCHHMLSVLLCNSSEHQSQLQYAFHRMLTMHSIV